MPSASTARAQLLRHRRIAQDAGDPRQRLQMIGAGALRREQHEDEVDRLVVERIEIDRAREPRKDADQPVERAQLAVRDGDALADAGRAQALALQQRVEDLALGKPGEPRGRAGKPPAAPASSTARAATAKRRRASGGR